MATVLLLSHEDGQFGALPFMVQGLFPHWEKAGHRVLVREGLGDLPEADVTFLHVDLSVVPEAYVEAARRSRIVINGATPDLSRRVYSEQLVRPGDGWTGPVIVKTDRNCGGMPEEFHRQVAQRKGKPVEPAQRFMRERYPVLPSAALVPEGMWSDPALVIERFLPEPDPRGYALRAWVFLGASERCNRVVGRHPIVKGADTLERLPVPVPDELRVWRKKLGIDYGKFDFVVHEGKPVLLDVNRTPSVPRNMSKALEAGNAKLATGLEGLLK